VWRHMAARYPKAIFYLHLLGYDQDPREIWEIVEAARYVRSFARAAGLDDMDAALQFFGPDSPTMKAGEASGDVKLCGTAGFLAACGVFGDDLKQEAWRNFRPTPRQ
jgi:hypothetical protein